MHLDELKKQVVEGCAKHGVKSLDLFGSRARSDSDDLSDFDFLVNFQEPDTEGISDRFFGLLLFLEDSLGTEIDLLDATALKNPFLKKTINRERVRLYEREN